MDEPPKSILILGAYGFIGSAIANALSAAGHRVTGFGRDISYGRSILPQIEWRQGDLSQYCCPQSWSPILRNIDVVINASGVLQSSPGNDVTVTQADAIIALGSACEASGISCFIQISACGASDQAPVDFMQSKARADRYLLASSLNAIIFRPGLVIGRNSYGGTELIRMIGAMPYFTPHLSKMGQVQTISLSEVADAVARAVTTPAEFAGSHDLVEEEPQSLNHIIARHREWLNFAPARWHIPISPFLMKLAANISDGLGWLGWRSPLRTNAVRSLIEGVQGDFRQTNAILGHPAKALNEILNEYPAGKQDRIHARLMLAMPLFLGALVILWLGSGILGLFKVEEAAALLGQQLSPATAKLLVISGAWTDIILGLGLLFRKTVRWALTGTIIVTLAYLFGGAVLTPGLWLDPLAPLIKAIAAMGLSITCLIALDKR
ncbi:SDR family oxidoreductase [uncultured Parasphingorhabdus sp.]|uniref:SDR family oxidoreductase n=1 Tax=uncultured Parasphingorhabdus sp. TaxID=2709694 RepID=UPI0030D820B6|tara:strand:- start:119778 stop:121088 length:1311 start_codon:yes stop_codon:yes gene_type:complete